MHKLTIETARAVIMRATFEALSEIRNCNEADANAQRLRDYHDRLALSLDPFASREAVDRRAIVGLRIQAAMRKRDRIAHLRKRIHAVPVPTALPDNVRVLRRRNHER